MTLSDPQLKIQITHIYRKLFKLRNAVTSKNAARKTYISLLRSRFEKDDYNERRQYILKQNPTENELTNEQIFKSIENTLHFIERSTISINTKFNKSKPTTESRILKNILFVEWNRYESVKKSKFTNLYSKNYISEAEDVMESIKNGKKPDKNLSANLIAFKDYEYALMMFNETMNLRL